MLARYMPMEACPTGSITTTDSLSDGNRCTAMRDGMRVITAQAYIPGITIGTFKIISSDLGWPKPQKNYPEAAHQIQ